MTMSQSVSQSYLVPSVARDVSVTRRADSRPHFAYIVVVLLIPLVLGAARGRGRGSVIRYANDDDN